MKAGRVSRHGGCELACLLAHASVSIFMCAHGHVCESLCVRVPCVCICMYMCVCVSKEGKWGWLPTVLLLQKLFCPKDNKTEANLSHTKAS